MKTKKSTLRPSEKVVILREFFNLPTGLEEDGFPIKGMGDYINFSNVFVYHYSKPQKSDYVNVIKLYKTHRNEIKNIELLEIVFSNNNDFTAEILEDGEIIKTGWHNNQLPGKALVEFEGSKFVAYYGGSDYFCEFANDENSEF